MNKFDAKTDKIAVVVKSFSIKRKSEFFLERFIKPYIISMAIDKYVAKALLKVAPIYSTSFNLLQNLSDLIAKQLQKNKDDKLFRRRLRDVKLAYDILRSFDRKNDFVKAKISIIPLSVSNKMGAQTKAIKL